MDETTELASASEAGAGGHHTRPPRYGAFVFGDRFPFNVTVDWDELRQRPELLAESLELLSEALPTEGGEFDLKVRFLGCISWCVKVCGKACFLERWDRCGPIPLADSFVTGSSRQLQGMTPGTDSL